MNVSIALLADHPEFIPELAATFEREWSGWYGVHGDATADLHARARRAGFPIGLIAIENGHAIGTVTIAEHSAPSHPHLSPWLIGFFVEPEQRNQGIGSQLLKAAAAHAREEGFTRLYTSTATAARLFAREGWTKLDVGRSEGGEEVEIFVLDLG